MLNETNGWRLRKQRNHAVINLALLPHFLILQFVLIIHGSRRVVLSTEEQERREATSCIYTSTDMRHTYP